MYISPGIVRSRQRCVLVMVVVEEGRRIIAESSATLHIRLCSCWKELWRTCGTSAPFVPFVRVPWEQSLVHACKHRCMERCYHLQYSKLYIYIYAYFKHHHE